MASAGAFGTDATVLARTVGVILRRTSGVRFVGLLRCFSNCVDRWASWPSCLTTDAGRIQLPKYCRFSVAGLIVGLCAPPGTMIRAIFSGGINGQALLANLTWETHGLRARCAVSRATRLSCWLLPADKCGCNCDP